MAEYRLNPQALNSNWGGVLNLALGSSMTAEECLEIVKKLDDISQNKFYTINVYDLVAERYYGDLETVHAVGDHYTTYANFIENNGNVHMIQFIFYLDGGYSRTGKVIGNIKDILSRLETIENKLNEITISETN